MRRFLFLFLLLLLIVSLPAAAAAQGEATLEQVLVELWPEYDQPEMLVILRLSLPETTAFPVPITIRIPARVGEPHAVAELSGDRLVTLPYERRVVDEWAEIAFTVNSPFFHLEYYDQLTVEGASRDYTYTWAGDYAVGAFDVSIKSPVGVSSMQISPPMGTPVTQDDGLNYYQDQFGSVAAGETLEVTLAYVKNDDALTVDFLTPADNTAGQSAGTAAGGEGLPTLTLVGIGLGVVLIALGLLPMFGVSLFGSRAKRSSYQGKKRATRGRRAAEGVFCHNCGTKALSGDKFCRECGTKLRGDS